MIDRIQDTDCMKKLLLLPLLFACASAHAVPNIWNVASWQGISEYSIQDSKERTLWIACNFDGSDTIDHSARLEIKGKSYQNSDSKYPLTFLLDGRKEVSPPGSTNWRNGANAWNEFVGGISKAKKIEVFLNNKKVTTFVPNKSSINEVAKDISKCRAKW